MRRRAFAFITLLASLAILAAALPASAQDYEELERPPLEDPVQGYVRSDGTVVLTDTGFCSYLLGSLWQDESLTLSRLIDKTRRQRKARRAAFQPAADEAVLQRCADVLNAFRLPGPEGEEDPRAAWVQTSPVVPEALAFLLPADLAASPLAQPDEVGDGSRTRGYGAQLSRPFGLTGGTYFVQVDRGTCESWSGTIRGARDSSLQFGAVTERGYLYDVQPASYYWDVTAPDCDWSVDLVPVDLGPEPTATPAPRAIVPKLYGEGWTRRVGQTNPDFLTSTLARQALLDVGLDVGECHQEEHPPVGPDRVWRQEPAPGTLLELGSTVDVWITSRCDILLGNAVAID